MKKKFVFMFVLMAALLQSINSLAFNGPRGQLVAGAAKVDITPELKDLPPTSQGILDHCYVRVIAFGNGSTKAAFVTFDAGGVNSNVAAYIDERASKELGIPEGNIIYNGTHTHSGGSGCGCIASVFSGYLLFNAHYFMHFQKENLGLYFMWFRV